jgi:hydroxyacylglutathione hydrolase
MKKFSFSGLEIVQFPVLADNYAFLVRDPASDAVTTIDTPDAAAILAQAEALGWRITEVWNTHWHPDHAGGNEAIKAATGAVVRGPAEVERIGHAPDQVLQHGDVVKLGARAAQVVDVGGHTLGHIAFHFAAEKAAFVGDTVFSLGCGRLFEGTAEQMWASFSRITAWPAETTLFCAHEYTASNARYAVTVEPDNAALQARVREIEALRAKGEPTVPMTLAAELAANPFLRAGSAARFGELRKGKDNFK